MPHINETTPSMNLDPTTQSPIKPRVGDRSFDAPSEPSRGSSPPPDRSAQDPELIKPRPGDRSFTR
jgi:hypothetical protein